MVISRTYLLPASKREVPYLEVLGKGRPVVFIHGLGVDSRDWIQEAERLAGQHRVIAPDLRGHGRAARSPEGYRPQLLANDVAELMKCLDIADAVLIGHSLGGVVASCLAVDHPELVASLVVLDPAYGRPAGHQDVIRSLVDQLRDDTDGSVALNMVCGSDNDPALRHVDDFVAERVRATAHDVPWQVMRDLHYADEPISIEPTSGRYLRQRQQPVLAVNRIRDRAQWEANLLASREESASLLWTDTPHFLHLAHPQRFHDLLDSWIRRTDGESSAKLPGEVVLPCPR